VLYCEAVKIMRMEVNDKLLYVATIVHQGFDTDISCPFVVQSMCRPRKIHITHDTFCIKQFANLEPLESLIDKLLAPENVLTVPDRIHHPTSEVSVSLQMQDILNLLQVPFAVGHQN
jgi:hypothetical protein